MALSSGSAPGAPGGGWVAPRARARERAGARGGADWPGSTRRRAVRSCAAAGEAERDCLARTVPRSSESASGPPRLVAGVVTPSKDRRSVPRVLDLDLDALAPPPPLSLVSTASRVCGSSVAVASGCAGRARASACSSAPVAVCRAWPRVASTASVSATTPLSVGAAGLAARERERSGRLCGHPVGASAAAAGRSAGSEPDSDGRVGWLDTD